MASQHKKHWFLWLFIPAGIASLIWFLIRVIPKPSRALYPCQRVAAPVAGSFIVWLLSLFASVAAFRKAKQLYKQRSRLVLCLACLCIAAVAAIIALINSPDKTALASDPPPNAPIGVARGLRPGRVVWVHDPNATNWGGFSDGYWFDNNHTDPCVVGSMLSNAVRSYAGASTDDEAWDVIFRHFNQTKGRGDVGYAPGEKITIKINMVTCIYWNHQVNAAYDKNPGSPYINNIDASPQMIRALLWQLVNEAGVAQSDIAIGDTLTDFCNQWYNPLHNEFPDVVFYDHRGTMGRTLAVQSTDPNQKIFFGNHGSEASECVTQLFADANYVINMANLKGHRVGMTLCAKNHHGSLSRVPYEGNFNLHLSMPQQGVPGVGKYRALVDLMGNKYYGGNTILFLIDGLYGGYYWDAVPHKWYMPPFNNDWPSSIFLSMDPVAIDSVGYDFIKREWPDIITYGNGPRSGPGIMGGAEDYLHEAALADNPPSGTDYNPDGLEGPGPHLFSLGTHEHWNDANNKQYSRNLGTGNGIELYIVDSNNSSPWVDAGPDQRVAAIAYLSGSVSDDGLPDPPANIEVQWSKISGPGTVTFSDENALDTIAEFSSVGIYVLRLTANDGAFGSCDEVTVTFAGTEPNVLASYEPIETHLHIATDANKDPSLTATWPVLGGVSNVPPATEANNVLKLAWTAETDRKVEVKHSWALFTFDLAGKDYLLADVYFADESSLPQIIGLWDDVFGWVSADVVPCTAGQWQTIPFPVANLDYTGLDHIYAFVFEGLAGDAGTIYIDNLRFGTIDDANPRKITFAGQPWWVKNTACGTSGPGPNYFSDSNETVWLDANEYLHLKITHVAEKWYCSEVVSTRSTGYGTYLFTVKGRVDLLDPNVVLGLFTWDTNAPQYNYREMDVEFSRWRNANDPNNTQYVIQPWDADGNRYRFAINCEPNDTTTHEFEWRPDHIDFRSYYGDYPLSDENNLIQSWSYTGGDIPPAGGENTRINLWLLPPENAPPGTPGSPPSNQQEVEIVVKNFKYLPTSDLDKDGDVDIGDLAVFADAWLTEPESQQWNPDCELAQPPDGIINNRDFAVWALYWLDGIIP